MLLVYIQIFGSLNLTKKNRAFLSLTLEVFNTCSRLIFCLVVFLVIRPMSRQGFDHPKTHPK